MKNLSVFVLALLFMFVGCDSSKTTNNSQKADEGNVSVTSENTPEEVPVFTLAWSEYPSWSAFGVAAEKGLVDLAEGKLGPFEKKYNVDVVLKEADYDTCITMYGSGVVDATCITNMDVLRPSFSVPSVVILPTSTSNGADALVTLNVATVQDLKKETVYGLEESVSQYVFARNLELRGLKESDYSFKNQDPAAAAQSMQTGQRDFNAIMVWNPFVNQTLKTVPNAKVLTDATGPFDSSTIPGEVLDLVVMSESSLKREGGERFATCVCAVYYELNSLLNQPEHREEILVDLGAKFSSLNAKEMEVCLKQTLFYSTPESAVKLLESKDLPKTMDKVSAFCKSHNMITKDPVISYDTSKESPEKAQLSFTTKYIEESSK